MHGDAEPGLHGTDVLDVDGLLLQLEGTLFAPNATVKLAGTTGGQALGAQIFARTAELVGGALLTLAPDEDRITTVGKGRPVLIR